jgi:hypothetical protein
MPLGVGLTLTNWMTTRMNTDIVACGIKILIIKSLGLLKT